MSTSPFPGMKVDWNGKELIPFEMNSAKNIACATLISLAFLSSVVLSILTLARPDQLFCKKQLGIALGISAITLCLKFLYYILPESIYLLWYFAHLGIHVCLYFCVNIQLVFLKVIFSYRSLSISLDQLIFRARLVWGILVLMLSVPTIGLGFRLGQEPSPLANMVMFFNQVGFYWCWPCSVLYAHV